MKYVVHDLIVHNRNFVSSKVEALVSVNFRDID